MRWPPRTASLAIFAASAAAATAACGKRANFARFLLSVNARDGESILYCYLFLFWDEKKNTSSAIQVWTLVRMQVRLIFFLLAIGQRETHA